MALLVIVGCANSDPSPSPTVTTASTTTVPGVSGIIWGDPSAVVEPQPGWSAHDCEGDAPLICVAGPNGETGLVEVGRFPHAPDPDPGAALRTLAADFINSITEDRAIGCGDDYAIEPLPVSSAIVAGEEGLRFGYVGRTVGGVESERNVQHARFDAGDVVVITAAAYAEGGCPGRDELDSFEPQALAMFDLGLSALVARLPLP